VEESMFLKRLDVVGFKSFADRIGIEFVPGVTAVVGPNGSGKSNISDSVRWVLGEQSAKSLRGSKMEDIIFAGSDSRKPLNVAEVTLTLDNEDQHLPIEYNEVSVTRRIYRSGDSEYLINKQQCRLKDIIDLFMDSGLGREAYSIIGQGKVEEILSSKPEERRKIFEEAAGVLKYKTRKQKAEQKLQETEDNLMRVEDILHELEGQVEPLKIQASIARDYLDKKEELKVIEVALIVHEIEELHAKWEQQSQLVAQLKAQEMKLSSEIKQEESAVEKLRAEMHTLDLSIDELQEFLLVTSEELEKLEGKREVIKERKKNYHQNKQQLRQTIQTLTKKKQSYEIELTKESTLLEEQKQSLRQTKKQLAQYEEQFALLEQDIETQLEQLKSEYIERLNEQASVRNEIRYLNEQLNQQVTKTSRLDQDHEKYIEQRKNVKSNKKTVEANLATVKEQLEAHIQSYFDHKKKLEETEKEYGEKESKLYQAFQYIQQFRSKKEMLEDMQEDYAGFFQGVKEVLKARGNRLQGIEGAVAELITVSKEYETAVETALGAAMQNIVVKDEASARQAIAFLKQNRFGRATFLPLSVVKSRKISGQDLMRINGHTAYLGIAAELITFDQRFEQIVSNLLGHVLIAKNLEGANEIAAHSHHRYRIVTLDGDVVNPGGSMSGGSLKQKNNSLLSRQRELETITEKLQRMEEQTAMLENEVKSGKQEIKQCGQQLEAMREKGEALRLEEQQLTSTLREIELEEKNANERLTLYDREKKSYRSEKQSIQTRLQTLESALEQATSQAEKLESEVESLSSKKKTQQSSKESIQASITEWKVTVAEKQQQLANKTETVNRLTKEKYENEHQLKEVEEDYWLLEEEVNSSSTGEEKLDVSIQKKRKDKDQTIQSIGELRNERLEQQTQINDRERELKELTRNQKQMVDHVHHEEVSINRLDVELENRLEHLREEYGLSFEGAKNKHHLTIAAEEARTKVKLIKLAIEELGTVNLGAIEEYERVSERYTFLTNQRDDLNHAKQTLYDVISEMDEEMTRRFQETFFEIKSHFQTIFQELFGGGRADLQLTNPEELLDTGVDILAQPPGKKLQHLALLSGGERALTAIALLFAILKVRPVPFCILDEVEAALDDANVNRFAKFLRVFSSQTQFIVVTHRKGTMEEADVLYGVTMQESGVSNLVSVRLEESKQLITN
jgi:chromosome segregation protein